MATPDPHGPYTVPDDQNADMSAPTQPDQAPERPSPQQIRAALDHKYVCPFCGAINSDPEKACPRCTLENTPATRQATKVRIGPWYVLQSRNPAAPGMKFSVLLSLVRRGQVSAQSIVRGPTTHQLWRFAAKIRGLSREFGLCYGCGQAIELSADRCPHCRRSQQPPANPDLLLASGETPGPPSAASADGGNGTSADVVMPSLPQADADGFGLDHRRAPGPHVPAAPPEGREPLPPPPGPYLHSSGATGTSSDNGEPEPAPTAPRPAPRPGEQILSARELAAAFKLNIAGHAGPPPRRKGRWLGKFVLLLLFLGAGSYGAALYLRPDLRQQSLDWVHGRHLWVKQRLGGTTPAPVPAPVPAPSRPTSARPPTGLPAAAIISPAATAPAPLPPTAIPEPAPRPRPPVATPPTLVPAPPLATRPAAIDMAEALEKSRALYRSALDAEGRRDYATAVRLYEQIRKLPPAAWPTDLDVRLARARRQ